MTTNLLRCCALLTALSLVACSGEPVGEPPLSRNASPIAGGVEDSDAFAHPAVVMLAMGGGACTASLIAPRLLLTARHCVSQNLQEAIGCDIFGNSTNGDHVGADYPPSSFEVYPGVYPDWGNPVATGAQLFHPPGGSVCNNDIALLVLSTAITGITPLPVRLDWGPQLGELTTAVGYGAINDFQSGAGKRRRRDNVPVLSAGQDWNQVIGSGELAVGQAACSGDSGGPVISAGGAVIGVASRVADCSDPNTSAKYVRLDAHKDLILQAFAAASAAPTLELGTAPPPLVKLPIGEGPCQTGMQCASALCQPAGGYCTDFCASANCPSGTFCADSQVAVSGQTIQEKLCILLPQNTPCEQCRSTDCVNVASTCYANPDCQKLLACVDACSDAACLEACKAQNPAGAEDYEEVRYCACNSSCETACGHQCAAAPAVGGAAGTAGTAGIGGGTSGAGGLGGSAGMAGSAGVPPAMGGGSSGGCSLQPGRGTRFPTWLCVMALGLALLGAGRQWARK